MQPIERHRGRRMPWRIRVRPHQPHFGADGIAARLNAGDEITAKIDGWQSLYALPSSETRREWLRLIVP